MAAASSLGRRRGRRAFAAAAPLTLTAALTMALALPACRGEAPEELVDRYALVGRQGEEIGQVRLLSTPDGLADRAEASLPGEAAHHLRVATEVSYADDAVTYAARRRIDRAEDEVQLAPAGAGLEWTRHKGLAVERRALSAGVHGVVDLPALPTGGPSGSLAGWAALVRTGAFPKEGGTTLAVINARSGREEPLRVEARERRTLRLGRTDVPAVRYFAWDAGAGRTIWVSEAGRLLSVSGLLAADRASLPGLALPEPARPERPAGVVAEDVYADGDGVRLAGTLTRPRAAGDRPLPLVILIHGSGPADRDENAGGMPIDLFRRLAYRLGTVDVAVLRYDKRGVGESTFTTDAHTGTLEDLAGDVRTWMDAMGRRPDIDGDRIFLLGHSEGGYIAPMVAADDPRAAGVVLLAGAADNLGDVIQEQAVLVSKVLGGSAKEQAEARRQEEILVRLVSSGRDKDLRLPGGLDAGADWLRSHFRHDPIAVLKRLRAPILALYAGGDFQVPPSQVPVMKQALARNPDATVLVLPGLDHLFMPVEAPVGLGMYFDPDRRPSKEMLDRVAGWIAGHLVPANPAPAHPAAGASAAGAR